MSGVSQFDALRNVLLRLLGVKSARGVYFSLSFLSALSKPLGYLRSLIIAWAFGTSAGMDAFHAASGIIALFAGSVGAAVESSVLPEMERLRSESRDEVRIRALFAVLAWCAIALVVLMCASFAIAPGVLVRFFASGFDDERVRMGALMIWWLAPFAVITMFRPITDAWALFTERYTLSSVCAVSFNFIAIPALLSLRQVIGVYAVAACMSIGHLFSFVLFLAAMKGVPLRVVPSLVSRESLSRIGSNALLSVLITSSGTLYVLVDKYFASRLPVGSVAALSYGATLFGILSLAALTPISFFMAKICRLVTENPPEAQNTVRQCVALVISYMLPACLFTAVAAKPIVSAIFGWGNFDARSVSMTATCLAGYNIGLVYAIPGIVLYRYALARQNLAGMAPLIYAMVALNALLDWAFVGRWGIWGLAMATSVTQIVSFIVYYKLMMDDSLFGFLIESKLFQQNAAVLALCALAWWGGRFGMAVQLTLSMILMLVYLFAAEWMGVMPCVPPHWRPRGLLAYLVQTVRSLTKNVQ